MSGLAVADCAVAYLRSANLEMNYDFNKVSCPRGSGGAEIFSRLPIMRGTILRGIVMQLDRVALVTQSGHLRLWLRLKDSFAIYLVCSVAKIRTVALQNCIA